MVLICKLICIFVEITNHMIQQNQLRIGNYLCSSYPSSDIPYLLQVDFIASKKDTPRFEAKNIGFIDCECDADEFGAQPIPITPEILEKCGFVVNGNELMYDVNDIHTFIIESKNVGKYYYTGGEGVELSREIQYVHELQNLYYAIEGEELEVKF
jgi:hypothetical protein